MNQQTRVHWTHSAMQFKQCIQ